MKNQLMTLEVVVVALKMPMEILSRLMYVLLVVPVVALVQG